MQMQELTLTFNLRKLQVEDVVDLELPLQEVLDRLLRDGPDGHEHADVLVAHEVQHLVQLHLAFVPRENTTVSNFASKK